MADKTYPHPQRPISGDTDPITLYDESDGTFAPARRVRGMVWDGTAWVKQSATSTGAAAQAPGVTIDTDDTAPPNRAATEGATSRLGVDRSGAVFVRPHGPQIWSYHEDSSNALTDAEVHAAPSAGLSLYVTDIVVSTGAATAFNIFFETASTKVLGPYYLEAVNGRGFGLHFQTPKKIPAATALTVTTSAAIAHSIDVTGFVEAG